MTYPILIEIVTILYRLQLETATKDTQKAGEIMKYAMNLANKTPFEAAPLVEGASKLEMMGLNAMKYLPLVGDMAAATNKPVDQAVEALIDSQSGELERLKEFGITKAKIVEKGNQLYRNATIVNNKGQIVDQEKFNAALEAIMTERYGGGMEKLSNSTKGLWSTVTGTTKTALAQIVGMTSDGTIKQGSLLDKLKEKVKLLAGKFDEWQSNGTIDNIAKKFSETFTKVYNLVSKVFNFIIKNKEIIITIASMAVTFTLVTKAIRGVTMATKAFQVIFALLKGTMALTPIGWVVVGITLLVGAFVLAYQKSEAFRNFIHLLWDKLKQFGSFIINELPGIIKKGFSDMVEGAKEKIEQIKGIWNGLINFLKHPIQGTINLAKNITEKSTNNKTDNNAVGTNYFHGGTTWVGEHGPELLTLPRGSKINTNSQSNKIANTANIPPIQITIQGNVIGNESFINQIGDAIYNKVNLALVNM